MIFLTPRYLIIPLLLSIFFALPLPIQAALFEQLAVSVKGAALANAVTAYPPGVMSIHYNPAGLSKLEGTNFTQGIFYIPLMKKTGSFKQAIDPETGKPWAPFGGFFNEGRDPLDGTEGSTTNGVMILPIIGPLPILIGPDVGVSYKPPGSRWTFGVAQYAPFAVGMEHGDRDDPNRFIGKEVGIQRLVVAAPAVAYQVSDTVSVGASFGIGINAMKFYTFMRTPNDMVAMTGAIGRSTEGLEIPILSELTLPPPWFGGGMDPYAEAGQLDILFEDFLSTSYNVGMLWEPTDWFAFGAVYQSESKSDLSGHYDFKYGQEFQNVVHWLGSSPVTIITASIFQLPYEDVPQQSGTATIELPLPARAQFGVKLSPIKRLRFLVDLNWSQWSRWNYMAITFDQDIQFLRFARLMGYQYGPRTMKMPTGLKDTLYLTYGLELDITDKLVLRLGYDPRPSSVPDEYYGPVPMPDMKIYSIGFGLTLSEERLQKPKDMMEWQHQLNTPLSIDACFLYITSEYELKNNSSPNFNSTNFTIPVYNPYAGLDYKQKITGLAFAVGVNLAW